MVGGQVDQRAAAEVDEERQVLRLRQRAEFLLEKGAIDMIVDRREMRKEIAQLLALLQNQPAEVLA